MRNAQNLWSLPELSDACALAAVDEPIVMGST